VVWKDGSCDVVIVNYNAGQYLSEAVQSVERAAAVAQIFVVDNASTDDSLSALASRGQSKLVIIKNTENFGFAKASNIGMAAGRSEFVLLFNPDCRVEGDAIDRLISVLGSDPAIGMVGPLLLNSDGSEQAGGRRVIPTPEKAFARAVGLLRLRRFFPKLLSDFAMHEEPLPEKAIEVEAISGACMLVSRAAIDKVGLFDEKYFLHCEDLDWCVRFRQNGLSILFVPDAKVFHEKGVSSHSRPFSTEYYKHRGMIRFYRKFLRDQYPWYLFYTVVAAVWVRYGIVACMIAFSRKEESKA
jgi:GT2 family glycosyltransferase